MSKSIYKIGVCLALFLCSGLMVSSCDIFKTSDSISGIVFDDQGPIADASVRIQATKISTITDTNGRFNLPIPDPLTPISVTAWKAGYYIMGRYDLKAGSKNIEIYLEQYTKVDNPEYTWLPSHYHPGEGENQGCAECHSNNKTEIPYTLPVDEWLLDSHSQSATNPRFLTMYNGTDVHGNQSPNTNYGYSQDYGTFPLPPDPDQLYYGPGYKLDFPDTDGNCAACHTPAASVNNPYGVDPSSVTGVAAEGLPCDFCHKILDIKLDDQNLPFANMPGVLSYEFLRPPVGHQIFFGPYDDVAPGEDTYSSLQSQSEFCAGCHFSSFWGTEVYNSYGEWLESPYSDAVTGQTCQDCHMPTTGNNYFARQEQGGLNRDPETIFSHQMPGAASEELLQNSVSMVVQTEQKQNQIQVSVRITNNNTGHHVPTDSPLRHLILLVTAENSAGDQLKQISGSITPDWVGIGDPDQGYYAGLPGKVYAKILQEQWTQISPSGSYWNPTLIISDNRLAAFESDVSTYSFEHQSGQPVTIRVTLLFRRAFIDLADQKGWDKNDILMEEEIINLSSE